MASLIHRQDGRTKKQFMKDIREYTRKEKLWAEIFKLELEYNNNRVTFEDNGVDNSGKLVKKACSKPDYTFHINNKKRLIEIKTYNFDSPQFTQKFLTYKVSSLKACQQAYILTVNKDWYLIFNPELITEYLLNENLHAPHIFPPFSPNDNVIRIYQEEIQKYLSGGLAILKYWKNPKSIMKIKQNNL